MIFEILSKMVLIFQLKLRMKLLYLNLAKSARSLTKKKKKVQLNAKTIYYLHYAIDRNEYNRVC